MADLLACPKCGSRRVVVSAEQMFMVNTGKHYCRSIKTHDSDAKVRCLSCGWRGLRLFLVSVPNKEVPRG